MKRTVVVIGGGVAGMSVAHELLERNGAGVDLEVHVYERNPNTPGGKARSIPVPNSGKDGRKDLPGEHGFRFFPGFYTHLPDTMRRIPYANGQSVFDNLVVADQLELARFDQPPVVVAARFPHSLTDLEDDFNAIFRGNLGLRPGELKFFAARIWQILTSCDDRRLAEYEKLTWADYLQVKQHSDAYRKLLVEGLSRSLLANDPHRASARTVGNTDVQLLLDIVEPGHNADRLLNGPTSEVWLDPWLKHLTTGLGAHYHFGAEAREIQIQNGRVSGVRIVAGGREQVVVADHYVFAVPVEKMAHLLHHRTGDGFQNPLEVAPALKGILELYGNLAWMNGMQFFLRRDVPIVRGHSLYVDSPWALTSISQAQFWSQEHLAERGDGSVRGVLSVCISDWKHDGVVYGRPAKRCTRQQIADEVWVQVQRSVNRGGEPILRDADLHSWFLDPDIREVADGVDYSDAEPLLINVADSWRQRPEARTGIPSLFLASDYVRTHTDVACMESANEAARRAANHILDESGSTAARCEVWKLHEPAMLAPFRHHDQRRFDQGLPWNGWI